MKQISFSYIFFSLVLLVAGTSLHSQNKSKTKWRAKTPQAQNQPVQINTNTLTQKFGTALEALAAKNNLSAKDSSFFIAVIPNIDVDQMFLNFDTTFKKTKLSQEGIDALKKQTVIDSIGALGGNYKIEIPQAVGDRAVEIFDAALTIYKPALNYVPAKEEAKEIKPISKVAKLKSLLTWKRFGVTTSALITLVGTFFAYKTGAYKHLSTIELPKLNFSNVSFPKFSFDFNKLFSRV